MTPSALKLDLRITIKAEKLQAMTEAMVACADAHAAMKSALEQLGRCLADGALEVQNGPEGRRAPLCDLPGLPASAVDQHPVLDGAGLNDGISPAFSTGHHQG